MKTFFTPVTGSFSMPKIGISAMFLLFLVAFQQPTAPISPPAEPMEVNDFYQVSDSLIKKRDFWEAEAFVKSVGTDALRAKDTALQAATLLISGKIALAMGQLSFTKSIIAFEAAEQSFLKQDTALWQLIQSRLGLAQSLFMQWDTPLWGHSFSYSERTEMLSVDSLLQAVIDALGKAHPTQIDALFLKGMNQIYSLKVPLAQSTLAPLQALQRRYSNYKKEYDYLLQANIALYSGGTEKAAVLLEKAAVLLKDKPASDFGLQQLCKAYLRLSDVYAEMDNMLLATECAQRVLIAMSVGFEEPENLLPNPEFSQLQHLPLCIDALFRKAKYIKTLDKTGFAAYNCSHLAAESCTHLQNQVFGKESLLDYKFRMMHAFSDALRETYTLYKSSEDTAFISDALYLIDREKSLMLWLECGLKNDSLIELEQNAAGQTWWYAKEATAAKTRGDSAAVLMFEQRKLMAIGQRETVVEALLKQNKSYLALKYAAGIPSLEELQQKLVHSELLLQYFNGSDSSYCLAISHNNVGFRCLASRDSVSKLTKTFDEELRDTKDAAMLNDKGGRLSKLLLPLDLTNVKRLIVIPDFGLFHIPFEVLPLPGSDEGAKDFKSYKYLFTQHSVSYQYSLASFWAWMHEKPAPASYRLLAIAFPPSNNANVIAELEYLSNRFHATILKDSTLSDKSLFSQAPRYGFLHFSGAKLAPDAIDGLRLRAALVLLNNMKTTVFDNDYAVQGFSYMQSGAAAVMTGLWPSELVESAKLLELFYERTQQGLSKDEALRQARISYLEQMPEDQCLPKLWAQHQVYGDYRNVAISEPISYIWWYLLPILGLSAIGWWAMRGLRQRKRF